MESKDLGKRQVIDDDELEDMETLARKIQDAVSSPIASEWTSSLRNNPAYLSFVADAKVNPSRGVFTILQGSLLYPKVAHVLPWGIPLDISKQDLSVSPFAKEMWKDLVPQSKFVFGQIKSEEMADWYSSVAKRPEAVISQLASAMTPNEFRTSGTYYAVLEGDGSLLPLKAALVKEEGVGFCREEEMKTALNYAADLLSIASLDAVKSKDRQPAVFLPKEMYSALSTSFMDTSQAVLHQTLSEELWNSFGVQYTRRVDELCLSRGCGKKGTWSLTANPNMYCQTCTNYRFWRIVAVVIINIYRKFNFADQKLADARMKTEFNWGLILFFARVVAVFHTENIYEIQKSMLIQKKSVFADTESMEDTLKRSYFLLVETPVLDEQEEQRAAFDEGLFNRRVHDALAVRSSDYGQATHYPEPHFSQPPKDLTALISSMLVLPEPAAAPFNELPASSKQNYFEDEREKMARYLKDSRQKKNDAVVSGAEGVTGRPAMETNTYGFHVMIPVVDRMLTEDFFASLVSLTGSSELTDVIEASHYHVASVGKEPTLNDLRQVALVGAVLKTAGFPRNTGFTEKTQIIGSYEVGKSNSPHFHVLVATPAMNSTSFKKRMHQIIDQFVSTTVWLSTQVTVKPIRFEQMHYIFKENLWSFAMSMTGTKSSIRNLFSRLLTPPSTQVIKTTAGIVCKHCPETVSTIEGLEPAAYQVFLLDTDAKVFKDKFGLSFGRQFKEFRDQKDFFPKKIRSAMFLWLSFLVIGYRSNVGLTVCDNEEKQQVLEDLGTLLTFLDKIIISSPFLTELGKYFSRTSEASSTSTKHTLVVSAPAQAGKTTLLKWLREGLFESSGTNQPALSLGDKIGRDDQRGSLVSGFDEVWTSGAVRDDPRNDPILNFSDFQASKSKLYSLTDEYPRSQITILSSANAPKKLYSVAEWCLMQKGERKPHPADITTQFAYNVWFSQVDRRYSFLELPVRFGSWYYKFFSADGGETWDDNSWFSYFSRYTEVAGSSAHLELLDRFEVFSDTVLRDPLKDHLRSKLGLTVQTTGYTMREILKNYFLARVAYLGVFGELQDEAFRIKIKGG